MILQYYVFTILCFFYGLINDFDRNSDLNDSIKEDNCSEFFWKNATSILILSFCHYVNQD